MVMPVAVISVVEQRLRAVLEVVDAQAAVTDVARRYGVDRTTVHRWLVRYANEGLGALENRSSKPDRCPHQISSEVEVRIIELRRAHPAWGPRTILSALRKEMDEPPSRSSIYRCLVRHRLIDPKPRRRKREDYKRWERPRSMELWQMDVMGGVKLKNGTQLSVVTGIDDHSRYCVIAKLVPRATARPVCDALLEGLKCHGIPEEILTDNGKVFTGKLARKPANVLFDRICLNNGIKHRLTAPYSPTTTGKVERLHKTMRKEFFGEHLFETISEAQSALDSWVLTYNHQRTHQAIGDVPPARRFELARMESLEVIDGEVAIEDPLPKPNMGVRIVDDKGRIKIVKHRYHVGAYLSGEKVGVESKDGLISVTHNGVVVATHARRHLAEDDVLIDRRSKSLKAAKPTRGEEVLRRVDSSGAVSFAGTMYRVGNGYRGEVAGVRIVGDTIQITVGGALVRTHQARHDKSKEFGALSQPNGKPSRKQNVA
jgi:transposase InsO family protein